MWKTDRNRIGRLLLFKMSGFARPGFLGTLETQLQQAVFLMFLKIKPGVTANMQMIHCHKIHNHKRIV